MYATSYSITMPILRLECHLLMSIDGNGSTHNPQLHLVNSFDSPIITLTCESSSGPFMAGSIAFRICLQINSLMSYMPLQMYGLRAEKCKCIQCPQSPDGHVLRFITDISQIHGPTQVSEILTSLRRPNLIVIRHSLRRRQLERCRLEPLRMPQATQSPQTPKPQPKSPPLNRRLDL